MEPIIEMNEMMQMMMANQTAIKIKPFSGKTKDYPKWELKQRNNLVMANMGCVLDESFVEKLPGSKTVELDPTKPEHRIKWWQ